MIRSIRIFDNMRYWGIDLNKAHQLYIGTYSRIDSIYNLIKNCRMKYRCWKYWQSSMLHDMYLAVVVANDMYLGVAEIEID